MHGLRALRHTLWRTTGLVVRALSLLTGQPAAWPALPGGPR